MNQIRQGDVFFAKVNKLPKGAVARKNNHILEGETSGHIHRLESQVPSVYDSGSEVFVSVVDSTPLVHEEHNTITVEPGVYKIVRQREYSPAENRRVLD